MTDCFWLEFDPDKLAILKQEAYELDLSLEEYLSEMLEDMVSFNREKTEDEANMDKYKTIKWKDREVESSAIERFSERWTHFIKDEIERYDVYLEYLAEEDPEADRHHLRLRHPRPGGSPHHERHRSRNEQRTHSADRLAYRYL